MAGPVPRNAVASRCIYHLAGERVSRERRQTSQTIAWFNDLNRRSLLNLDPPYQRRSVWNQAYKDYFVDTILLQYPAPAIFLYENISSEGLATYSVVDGKQRLSAIFEFVSDDYFVSEKCPIVRLRGLYFSQLPDDVKKAFWTYQFVVEYLQTTDESTLNSIFDRINRNVARLTQQELRHARYSGAFASSAEILTTAMQQTLPQDFPRIADQSRRQMKDVELVSQLLLSIEQGIDSYSQSDLDAAYSQRDEEWDAQAKVEEEFRAVLAYLADISPDSLNDNGRRLRNQTDFYSLFMAIIDLRRSGDLPSLAELEERVSRFFAVIQNDSDRVADDQATRYYEAARSASNDVGPRNVRVEIIRNVVAGR